MWKLGLNDKQIQAAILAVCDANDTKSADKTASHIKASIDKGVGLYTWNKTTRDIEWAKMMLKKLSSQTS